MQMLKPNYLVAKSLPSELIKKLRDLGIIFVKLDSIKELEELKSSLEREVQKRTKELENEKKLVNSILNSQESIVVTSDGEKLITVNLAKN